MVSRRGSESIDQRIQMLLTLSTVLGAGRSNDGGHFPVERLGGPEAASGIEEGRDLSDSTSITSRD